MRAELYRVRLERKWSSGRGKRGHTAVKMTLKYEYNVNHHNETVGGVHYLMKYLMSLYIVRFICLLKQSLKGTDYAQDVI